MNIIYRQNNITSKNLLKRLINPNDSDTIKVKNDIFIKFIKNKVDKKRSYDEINDIVNKIDIDKDGYIDINDLDTCIGNIDNKTFFNNNGAALTTISIFILYHKRF